MTSIFTIERRKDFKEAFSTFYSDLQSPVTTSTGDDYKMLLYLERCLRYWPYRCGATGIDDYLQSIDVDIKNLKDDKDRLLALELLINLLHWALKQDYNDYQNTEFSILLKKNDIKNETERILHNAAYILEQCCNMTIREETSKGFPKYFITKRNALVDVAAVATPKLSEVLLGYLDIRNAENVEFKKTALTTIYGYMEPHRKEYRGFPCSSISEEFFTSMNTFGIRHNTKSQVSIRTKRKMDVCDELFMMAVYVLQTAQVIECKNNLKEVRERAVNT